MSEVVLDSEGVRVGRFQHPALKLGLFGGLLAVGVGLLIWMGLDWRLWVDRLADLHPLVYVAALSLLPAIGFPISAFYFYAGVVYGWKLGIPLCLLGLAINMTVSYWLTRTLLRDPLRELVRRRGHELPTFRTTRNQFRATFLLRTVPGPPYSVQNYLLALAGVPFAIYLPVSLAGQGVIGSMFILSTGLLSQHFKPWVLIAGGVSLLLLGGLAGSLFFKRKEKAARPCSKG